MTWIIGSPLATFTIAKVSESLTGRKINIYESQQMNTYCWKSTTSYQPHLVSMYRKFEHKLKLFPVIKIQCKIADFLPVYDLPALVMIVRSS